MLGARCPARRCLLFHVFLFQELRRRRPGAAMANGASSAAGAGSCDGGNGGATAMDTEDMKECTTPDSTAASAASDTR